MRQQPSALSPSTRAAASPLPRRLRAGLLLACLIAVGAVAAPEAPLPPPQSPSLERIDNPYGIEALWHEGDWVARATLLVLLAMSAGSWYVGIVKLIEQAQLMREARRTQAFWQAPTLAEGARALRADSPFRYIAEEGLHAAAHHEGTLVEQIELVTWIGMSIQHAHDVVNSRLQGGLAFLATVGSTAPFVGLFGTVWGIYHALTAIGIAGQASIDKVAGPVGEALIMTAFGLAVAVPAVLGYNWLVRRNKVAMELVRHFSNEVHMALLGKPDRRTTKAG